MEADQKVCDSYDGHHKKGLQETSIAVVLSLETLAGQLRRLDQTRPPVKISPASQGLTARRIYQARRKADEAADFQGFSASPAFDAMLDLYIHESEGRCVSVSSACIGTACPPTTALRWLRYLEAQALVARGADPLDQRRVYLRLTPVGKARIEEAIAHYRAA